jgi:hypothetical protein
MGPQRGQDSRPLHGGGRGRLRKPQHDGELRNRLAQAGEHPFLFRRRQQRALARGGTGHQTGDAMRLQVTRQPRQRGSVHLAAPKRGHDGNPDAFRNLMHAKAPRETMLGNRSAARGRSEAGSEGKAIRNHPVRLRA